MRKIIIVLSFFIFIIQISAWSQITLTQLPSGGNKKAWVGERVGLTDITIHYDRPGVKGREGRFGGNWYTPVLLTRASEILSKHPGGRVQMKILQLSFQTM